MKVPFYGTAAVGLNTTTVFGMKLRGHVGYVGLFGFRCVSNFTSAFPRVYKPQGHVYCDLNYNPLFFTNYHHCNVTTLT